MILRCVAVMSLVLVECLGLPSYSSNYYHEPNVGVKSLFVKTFPGVDDVQSDLFEVYMEPYGFDLRAVSAIALLEGVGESPVKGEVVFIQKHPPEGPVFIKGNFTGLPTGKHGIHIHQSGDLRNGCEKLGGHFNPYFMPHGAPTDLRRHVGDLGNVEAEENGNGNINIIDPIINLSGNNRGIVGRALVLTEEEDDLGKGGTADSATTGSTKTPIACGIIAYIK